jgi:hypothetical protein
MKERKRFSKKDVKEIVFKTAIFSTLGVVGLVAALYVSFWLDYKSSEEIALATCVEQVIEKVEPEVSLETVENNCETFKERKDATIKQYLAKAGVSVQTFSAFVSEPRTTVCGDWTNGCVSRYGLKKINTHVDFMEISLSTDYFGTLEHTVAHELVHIFTSEAEMAWLIENAHLFPSHEAPYEAVADCGIKFFTGEFEGGSYLTKEECTPEREEIAYKIITDTLLK